MPIYAYKCAACGFAKDVLRKMSDPALTQCPSCQAESFEKQVTAAGFQLKGSGWYVTDFRDGGKSDSSTSASRSGSTDASASSASTEAAASTGSTATATSSSAPASGSPNAPASGATTAPKSADSSV